MAPKSTDQEWYSIAEQISKEMDSAKLTILVAQLCSALDERNRLPESAMDAKWVSTVSPSTQD